MESQRTARSYHGRRKTSTCLCLRTSTSIRKRQTRLNNHSENHPHPNRVLLLIENQPKSRQASHLLKVIILQYKITYNGFNALTNKNFTNSVTVHYQILFLTNYPSHKDIPTSHQNLTCNKLHKLHSN